jgi:hypothetical protein
MRLVVMMEAGMKLVVRIWLDYPHEALTRMKDGYSIAIHNATTRQANKYIPEREKAHSPRSRWA